MTLSTWFVFVAVGVACVVSPGPAVLLAVTNGAKYGPKAPLWSSLGNITGLLLLSTLAMVGVGALVAASKHAFVALKLAGALYLLYLGVRQWRSRSGVFAAATGQDFMTRGDYQVHKLYSQAFLVAMTNPKAILFFSALFPQFLSSSQPLLPQAALLTITFMALSFTALVCYGLLAARITGWLVGRGHATTWPNKVFGGTFMAFGCGLLALSATTH